jgi:sugar lactone lactonase YvrE
MHSKTSATDTGASRQSRGPHCEALRLRTALAAVCAALASIAVAAENTPSAPTPTLSTVVALDPAARENPESIVVDYRGNIYVSLASRGEIRRIAPDGTQGTFATLPAGSGTVNGLVFDGWQNLYAALSSRVAETHGVWRVEADGASKRIAALPVDSGPNGMTFDRRGNLFVADSRLSTIWRVARDSDQAVAWLQSELLAPGAGGQFPIGANGVKFWRGELYVSNTDSNTIVKVPVAIDGSAGAPSVYLTGVRSDDFLFDWRGNLYAATGFKNEIVRVDAAGNRETLLTGANGIDSPSALAFSRERGAPAIYISNLGFLSGMPSVQRLGFTPPSGDHTMRPR